MSPRKGYCRQFAASGSCTYGEKCKFPHVSAVSQSSPIVIQALAVPPQPEENSAGDHFTAFFSQYPAFRYNSTKPVMSEFYRMCDSFEWEREDDERKEARDLFRDALVQEFNLIYGTNENDIEAWHGLCRVLNITPLPQGLKACRTAVTNTHVNLVDLVDLPRVEGSVQTFVSEVALSKYTKETGNFFPKENAYAGGLLKHLLRQILHPRSSRDNRPGGRRRPKRE